MGGVLSDEVVLSSDQRRLRPRARYQVEVDGSLVRRRRERPAVEQTQVFKNPVHVQGKSVQLICARQAPDEPDSTWELTFDFDTTEPCEVVIYTGVEEQCVDWPPANAAWASEGQRYPAGLSQKHRSVIGLGDTTPTKEAADDDGTLWVLACIEVHAVAHDASAGPLEFCAAEWTKVRLTSRRCEEGRLGSVEFLAQEVRLPGAEEASRYDLHEVYGADAQDAAVLGQDCVVCLADKTDTEVQPCRHMCLCKGCAELLSGRVQHRSLRCPICRERVTSFLQIEPESRLTASAGAEPS